MSVEDGPKKPGEGEQDPTTFKAVVTGYETPEAPAENFQTAPPVAPVESESTAPAGEDIRQVEDVRSTEQKAEVARENGQEQRVERAQEVEKKETERISETASPAYEPMRQKLVELAPAIREQTTVVEKVIENTYDPKTGLAYTAGPGSQFYLECWSRDGSKFSAAVAKKNPQAAVKTLEEPLKYQQANGLLPLRTERIRHWARSIPIIKSIPFLVPRFRWTIPFKVPFPVYENTRGNLPVRDSAPAISSAMCEVARMLPDEEKRDVLARNWHKLHKALQHEQSLVNPENGLVSGGKTQDWMDSLILGGERTGVNIVNWYARRNMSVEAKWQRMDQQKQGNSAEAADFETYSKQYDQQAENLKESINQHLWNEEGGYFMAGVEKGEVDTTFDTFANLMAINSGLATPEQSLRILENLQRVKAPSGLLKNVDPPYGNDKIRGRYKMGNIHGYHNEYTWQWVTAEAGKAYLVAARRQQDPETRLKLRQEAVNIFVKINQIQEQNKGVYEVLNPETGRPIVAKRGPLTTYKSAHGFMGSAATYLYLKNELERDGLLASEGQEAIQEGQQEESPASE